MFGEGQAGKEFTHFTPPPFCLLLYLTPITLHVTCTGVELFIGVYIYACIEWKIAP